jgi:PAS domain S-box-containing protein
VRRSERLFRALFERTAKGRREADPRFAAVFEQAAGGIACTDMSGRFEMVNDPYCKLVGRSRAELSSQRIQEITHPDDLARNLDPLRALVRGGPPCSFEQRYVRPDGAFAWVSQDVSVVRDDAGAPRGVIAVCHDIQERKLAEALLLEQRRLLESVATGSPLDECLRAFSAAVPRLSPGVRACALLVEASGKTLDRCVAAELPDAFPVDFLRGAPIDAPLLAPADPSGGVSCEDIANDARWSSVWRDVCAAQCVAACHFAPVLGPDRSLLALLVLSFRQKRGPTSHERRLAEIGAHVASIAIERDRTAQELRERGARLSAELKLASDLHELGTRLLATPDMPAAAQQVLDAVLEFVGAEIGTVQVDDPVAGGLRIVAQRGFDPLALETLPVIGPHTPASLSFRSQLSTPLRTREGEILGVLNVHFPRTHQPSARELRTIDLCVRPLAHLMERARVEAALRQHNEKFRVLVEGAPYGICLVDAELRLRQLNATARQLLGAEPIGEELREVLRVRLMRSEPERVETVMARFRNTLETGEPHSATEWAVLRSDGSTEWFDWQVQRVPLANGAYGLVAYFVDVSPKVQARTTIAASEERYRSLVSVLTDVPWTANPEGAFVEPQPAWSAFTGQGWEECRGFGWVSSIHPDDREAIWKLRKVDAHYEVGGRLWQAPTEQYRHFVARAVPFRNADGAISGWVGSCTDVTEQRRAERALRDANRRKDDFLALLGHELRNPLGALRSAITLASLDEARRESALAIAGRQVEQLGHLIDDLFDVARITQGRISLHKQPVKLADVLERAAEECRPSMDERGHRLVVVPPREELYVEIDPARFEQVLGNLLANAARYTEPGGNVRVVGERDGDEAVIRVKDDGIGIAPELLCEIFEPFAQADRRSSRSEGGLGIGLNVVRQLVELHGGRVAARSEGPGTGAEFIVRLPALAPPDRMPELEAPEPCAAPARARVLVVEDNRDAAASMRMLLEYMGHSPRVAYDGAEALDAARADAPELIFVDIGLPDMDGYEVARRIRQDPALRSTRLVALTGYGREDDKQRARAAGFDQHLVKPAALETLRELFSRLLGPEADVRPD